MKKDISVSVIIPTYNWPEALNLCLQSVLSQSILPDEIIIADDGSRSDTAELINNISQQQSSVPIIHVWQEDNGFRLTQIRNKAIAKSSKEYILQIDGDVILHKDFIKDHIRFARIGSFVSGSRVTVEKEMTNKLLKTQDFNLSLYSKGIHNRLNGIHLPFLSFLQEKYRRNDILYVRGCNMAFWREDLLKVNGYNEEMTGWGREDNELASRLINAGIEKRIIKFAGIVYHLHHSLRPRTNLNKNDLILRQSVNTRAIRCAKGISQHIDNPIA
ncbi:glycosyltransferase family 2 protein [Bacteroides reticulotermitis]|uniref:Two-domain glycosyltransferase n=2 Tax=Bacteroides reticulotermitis TaxID=1133319 RepID=W4UN75_9BACE|nr:glycosyltransferase family 2 protein [Bacteroides reticulotermitis]MBB4044045.1 glycosyltransferase involved in cell wall biosynthesis [Bacteroides reticulotermitis]GAE82615.1 two-domain glycosyltransferase [Bacteroides reticulotermitis JCM 10512]